MTNEELYTIVRQGLSPEPNPTHRFTYRGVPLEMFTREELIEIVKELGRDLIRERQTASAWKPSGITGMGF